MVSKEEELKQALTTLSKLSDLKAPTDDEIHTPESRQQAFQLLTASTLLFSTLKRLNRIIYTDVQSQKTRVAEERSKVDTARLALQNLKYEEAMLELEVKVCQEFQSIFQTIPLHSLEEFNTLRKSLGEEEGDEEEGEQDDHKLMLARLKFELKERKRLETEKQKLQQDKTEVARENKEKKVKLEETEKQLKDLLAAALAVQAKLESF
ncbi:uncharacterized protein UHOD_05072 [Ustilago sp. UG-2017b]|nr:uncharacterized protein UHOD_05072 [Ustilago sp. UG-2017b]